MLFFLVVQTGGGSDQHEFSYDLVGTCAQLNLVFINMCSESADPDRTVMMFCVLCMTYFSFRSKLLRWPDFHLFEHWWLLPRLFRIRSWIPLKSFRHCRFGMVGVVFFFMLRMVCCVHSLEWPRWGDSNGCSQRAFVFKKIGKISPTMPLYRALWLALVGSNYPCLGQVFYGFKGFWSFKVLLYVFSFFLCSPGAVHVSDSPTVFD